MRRVIVTFKKIGLGLHMRPAAMIVRFATLFADYDIKLAALEPVVHDTGLVDAKSIMNLTMATVTGESVYWLLVRARRRAARGKEDAVLDVMKTFLENLHLAAELYADRPAEITKTREKRELYLSLVQDVLACHPKLTRELIRSVESNMSEMLQIAADSVEAKSGAILQSPRGLHHASVSLLNKVASTFVCSIMLVFLDDRNQPQSCDPRSLMELLSAGVKNGTRISIKARGGDAEKAVALIKKILENLGRLEGIAIKEKMSLEKTSEAMSFLKRNLHLSDAELPEGF